MLDVRSAMRRSAGFNRDRIAVICGDRRFTFAQAWERGLRMANGLLGLGAKAGDRIGVLEDNSLEAADFFLGAAAANLVRVPMYKRNSREAHGHMLRHTNCRILVVGAEHLHEVEGLQASLPDLEHVVVRGPDYETWLASQSAVDPNPDVSLDDYYIIRHSSGTTGVSKGFGFSHRQWMATARDWTHHLPPIHPGDVCVHAAPISHGSGMLFIPIWLAGACNLLEPKFDANRILNLLSLHGGYFFGVPTVISDLINAANSSGKSISFPRLKAIVVSGAPIRAKTALAARDLFGENLYQMYGQTEAVPVAFMGPSEWFGDVPGSDPLSSVGRVIPFAEVEIRNDQNLPLGTGEVGEIAIRTDGQMAAVWDEPELTAERLIDGWVLTRDVGRLDQNGYLYLVDRKDDMIISGGFNIWPAELEIVIAAMPGVREVAVVGIPSERWGESPAAFVVVEAGSNLKAEEIIRECADRLGSYKKPSLVVFRSEPLPRTPVGKILRKALRDPYWKEQEGPNGGN